jgi:threonine dehydrogenase-like Zn-dependent dehydrogenase
LVLGAGTIGILAALAFRARGLAVTVTSLEPESHVRARLLMEAGVDYVQRFDGAADVVLEATGSAEAAFQGLRRLAPLGVFVVLGAHNATGEMPFLDMLVRNQRMAGVVNASPASWLAAVADLGRFPTAVLGGLMERVPVSDYARTLAGEPSGAPKLVHVW